MSHVFCVWLLFSLSERVVWSVKIGPTRRPKQQSPYQSTNRSRRWWAHRLPMQEFTARHSRASGAMLLQGLELVLLHSTCCWTAAPELAQLPPAQQSNNLHLQSSSLALFKQPREKICRRREWNFNFTRVTISTLGNRASFSSIKDSPDFQPLFSGTFILFLLKHPRLFGTLAHAHTPCHKCQENKVSN